MSIPAEPSLSSSDNVLHHDIADLFLSLPCHFVADIGGLALSMAKSHWHGALRSAHKSCTRGHMSRKRGGWKRELVAAP